MDKITLSNMKFFGYHGCEDFEKNNGQIFEVDAEILADLKTAGQTDSLGDAINYVDIFNKIKTVMEKERYDLLERVAQRLAACILEEARIVAVIVRIRKPAVPIPGPIDYIEVEAERHRK